MVVRNKNRFETRVSRKKKKSRITSFTTINYVVSITTGVDTARCYGPESSVEDGLAFRVFKWDFNHLIYGLA